VTRRAKRIIKLVGLAAVSVVVGLVLHQCYQHYRGIEVCLRNVDSKPLRAGEVAVRSSISTRLYWVGDLAPGDRACVWVKPDNEASVDVTFTTQAGKAKVMPLNGYVEQTNRGWISADVASDGAQNVREDIRF
jgi:hypothetical protein